MTYLDDRGKVETKAPGAARVVLFGGIALWFAAACVVGVLDRVNQPGRPPTILAAFIAVPMAAAILAYLTSATFRAAAAALPLSLLVGAHLWRFVGVGFVIGWLVGVLPGGFGVPEGLGDIVAAAGALALLPSVRRGTASRGWLLAWNTWGLVDLVSALTMGLLYSESALGLLSAGTPTTRLMVTFPVSLIPTFFVPLFLLVHLLTFKRLARSGEPAGSPGVAVAPPVR
jgi:hypothetical protein